MRKLNTHCGPYIIVNVNPSYSDKKKVKNLWKTKNNNKRINKASKWSWTEKKLHCRHLGTAEVTTWGYAVCVAKEGELESNS